jgi:putative flippase GtrA
MRNNKIKNIIKKLLKIRFIRYTLASDIAVLFDWTIFYILSTIYLLHYQQALLVSFSVGSIVSYNINKKFTFQCKSKKIAHQVSTYWILSFIALGLSMMFIFFFVSGLSFSNMLSRILTSIVVLPLHYALHKNITFNKKHFN